MADIKPNFPLRFSYKRSVGPVIGRFLAGLRDRKVVGIKTASGRVLVPPLEYDPDTGEAAAEFVDVASVGTIVGCAKVDDPKPDRPAGWALVKLDGADTSIFHALEGDLKAGDRVRIRWADERVGHIKDIHCFEPAAGGGV